MASKRLKIRVNQFILYITRLIFVQISTREFPERDNVFAIGVYSAGVDIALADIDLN